MFTRRALREPGALRRRGSVVDGAPTLHARSVGSFIILRILPFVNDHGKKLCITNRPLSKNFSEKYRKVIDKSPRRVYNVGIITKEA